MYLGKGDTGWTPTTGSALAFPASPPKKKGRKLLGLALPGVWLTTPEQLLMHLALNI